MKRMKWVARYCFLALVLALCVGFSVYCGVTAAQLEAKAESVEFVELALTSVPQAQALLDQIGYYQGLMKQGIIVSAVVLGALILLILWHIFGHRLKLPVKKPKAEPAPAPASAVPVQPPAPPVPQKENQMPAFEPAQPVPEPEPAIQEAPAFVKAPDLEPVLQPVPELIPEPETQPAPAAAEVRYCPVCGTPLAPGSQACATCGTPWSCSVPQGFPRGS